MTIQAVLSDLPQAPLFFGRTGRGAAAAAAAGPIGGVAAVRQDPAADNEGDDASNFEVTVVAVGNTTVGDDGAAGSGGDENVRGSEWASMLSSAVSGALTGARGGKGQQEGGGGSAGGAGAAGVGAQQKNKWSRLGQKELNRQRRSEAIYVSRSFWLLLVLSSSSP